MADLAALLAERDSLKASLNSGVMSMSVDGQSTSLATMEERRKQLVQINAEIAICTGQARKRPVASQVHLGGFQP